MGLRLDGVTEVRDSWHVPEAEAAAAGLASASAGCITRDLHRTIHPHIDIHKNGDRPMNPGVSMGGNLRPWVALNLQCSARVVGVRGTRRQPPLTPYTHSVFFHLQAPTALTP